MVPHYDRLAVEVQGTQEDEQLQSPIVGGKDGIYMLPAREHAPCVAQHHTPSGQSEPRLVPHHVDAMLTKACCSIEKMRRKLARLHPPPYILYVLRMVEINLHCPILWQK